MERPARVTTELLDAVQDEINPFGNGRTMVRRDDEWLHIDRDGVPRQRT